MEYLLDVNVWLSLTFSAHHHHQEAVGWFDGVPNRSCAFNRMTQNGYLRLTSNPKAFQSDALSLPLAWKAFDALRGDARTFFADEPSGLEEEWRSLTNGETFSAKIWNDAFLAASAKLSGHTMVTFDKGFQRYPGLSVCLLAD